MQKGLWQDGEVEKGEREMAEVEERAAKSVRNTGGGGWLGNRSDGVVNMQP